VPPDTSPLSFDAAQHLVSAAAGEPYGPRDLPRRGPHRVGLHGAGSGPAAAGGTAGLRSRLAQLLDAVSGTPGGPAD